MNGISLFVNGEALDLGNAKVRLKIRNPLLEPQFIAQSYSYPFTVPWTPKNARLMRHAERLANAESIIELQADIHLGGVFFARGVLKYRRYRDGFDCDLMVPPDPRIEELGSTMLTELDLGQLDLLVNTPLQTDLADIEPLLEATVSGGHTTTNFVLAPVKNSRPVGNNRPFNTDYDDPYVPGVDANGYINYYRTDLGAYNWFNWPTPYPNDGVLLTILSPFPYLRVVVEKLFNRLGLNIASPLFAIDEFNRMVCVGNLLIGASAQTTVLNTIGGNYIEFYDYIRPAEALPRMNGVELLVALQRRFNGTFYFKPGNDVVFLPLKYVLNGTAVDDVTHLSTPSLDAEITEGVGYTLKEEFDNLDELSSERQNITEYTINYTVDSYGDLSGLTPSVMEIALVRAASALYQYVRAVGGSFTWRYLTPSLGGVVVGDGKDEVSVGVSLTQMYNGADEYLTGRSWLVPEVQMLMSDWDYNIYGIGRNDRTTLRLLFYRGLQEDSDGNPYPLLSNGTRDYSGNVVEGAEWEERIDGDAGIYELWYREPLALLRSAKRCTRSIRLPLAQVINFDFTRKLAIDGLHYLVDTIDVEFTGTGMGIPRVDLLKL